MSFRLSIGYKQLASLTLADSRMLPLTTAGLDSLLRNPCARCNTFCGLDWVFYYTSILGATAYLWDWRSSSERWFFPYVLIWQNQSQLVLDLAFDKSRRNICNWYCLYTFLLQKILIISALNLLIIFYCV